MPARYTPIARAGTTILCGARRWSRVDTMFFTHAHADAVTALGTAVPGDITMKRYHMTDDRHTNRLIRKSYPYADRHTRVKATMYFISIKLIK